MTAIQPEIIPDGQRVRLLKSGDKESIYKPAGKFAAELKRKPETLREWANLLLLYSPDFHQHFKPRKAYNPYVQAWFKRINDHVTREPKSAPRSQIVEDYISLNAQSFTFKSFIEELQNECNTERKIDNSKLVQVA